MHCRSSFRLTGNTSPSAVMTSSIVAMLSAFFLGLHVQSINRCNPLQFLHGVFLHSVEATTAVRLSNDMTISGACQRCEILELNFRRDSENDDEQLSHICRMQAHGLFVSWTLLWSALRACDPAPSILSWFCPARHNNLLSTAFMCS